MKSIFRLASEGDTSLSAGCDEAEPILECLSQLGASQLPLCWFSWEQFTVMKNSRRHSASHSPNMRNSFFLIVVSLSFLFIELCGCDNKKNTPQTNATQTKTTPQPSTQATAKSEPQTATNESPKKPADAPTYEAKLAKAEVLLEAKNTDEAWKLAKELMIEKPDAPTTLFIASRTLAQKNDLAGAIQLLSRVKADDPQAGPAATGQLSEWLAQQGDLSGAEAKLLPLLKSYPNAVPALRLLIDIYSAQGRRWESANYIERLIRIGNFNEQDLIKSHDFRESYDNDIMRLAATRFAPNAPYSRLGAIRLLVNKDQWNDAIGPLESIAMSQPELLEPWIWYGAALQGLGRTEELARWLEKRPQGFASHPEYWYIHGTHLAQQGNLKQASRCFVESIRLDRRHVASMNALVAPLFEFDLIEAGQRVRDFAADLVRINKLQRRLFQGQAGREAYVEIAEIYNRLGDELGAFGWETILTAKDGKPLTEALIAKQKALRNGAKKPPAFLADLPTNDWPLPDDKSFQALPVIPTPFLEPGTAGIALEDVASELQLNANYHNGAATGRGWFILESNGGGVSALDYDRDGWPDFFFSQAGDSPTQASPNYEPKQLFRSQQSKRFEDVTASAYIGDLGYGQGTGAADIDQDGFTDLIIANIGAIEHYRNQGDGTFERMELPQAPTGTAWNSSIQAGDINRDGLPDIVQGVYIDGTEAFTKACAHEQKTLVSCHPRTFSAGKSRILFNRGDGNWTVATPDMLEMLQGGYNLGTMIGNIDHKDGNDVYLANDVSPNYLLTNRPTESNVGRLVESGASAGVAVDSVGRAQGSMGLACGDQDRNGLIDIVVTNNLHEGTTLYLQKTPGAFIDGTRRSGIGLQTLDYLSWGCQLTDLDNDGWLDLTILSGHIDDLTTINMPWKMMPQVFKNDKGKFLRLSNPTPGKYFEVMNSGRGLTATDYNRDGRMDMVATHLDRPCALLENRSVVSNQHYIQLELVGTQSERDATGSTIRVKAGEETWVVPVNVGDGFFGTNERIVHIGIGVSNSIDSLQIEWPSGKREQFENVAVDQRWLVTEGLGITSR